MKSQTGKGSFRRTMKKYWMLYILMLPALCYLLINNYLPMIGLSLAFREIDFSEGIWGGKWVGFKNFEYLFKTTDALIITRNTLFYNFSFLVLVTFFAVMVALLFSEVSSSVMKKFYQCSILLPYMISIIIISYLARAFLDSDTGFLNTKIIPAIGLERVSWYSSPEYWPFY